MSGFFQGFPGCVGLSRCVILDSVGGRTQLHGIFSSILILIVILFAGPLFRKLPNVKKFFYVFFFFFSRFFFFNIYYYYQACLASIIVIALKHMLFEVSIFPKLLRKNRMEAVISSLIFYSFHFIVLNTIYIKFIFLACLARYFFGRNDTRRRYWTLHWRWCISAFSYIQNAASKNISVRKYTWDQCVRINWCMWTG